jgi:hypothetical protein
LLITTHLVGRYLHKSTNSCQDESKMTNNLLTDKHKLQRIYRENSTKAFIVKVLIDFSRYEL